MLKIIIVTPLLQHYRLSFYEKLSKFKNDYFLTVFYGVSIRDDGKAGYTGKTVFNSRGFKEYKIRIFSFDIVFNRNMYSETKKLRPDVIIVLASAGNITYWRVISWAKRNNIKVIIWTSGWEPGRAKGLLLSFKNKMVSTLFKKADFFLTYSTYASIYVESRGIAKSKIQLCYNGIEIDDLVNNSNQIIDRSKELIKEYGLVDHITFLYVGGLIEEKKVDLLINAFIELQNKYPKTILLIIGDGPLRNMIEAQLDSYDNPNIKYLGRIISGVDAFFAASDCLVLPGAGGLALNQAMFWRKPCIVSIADGTEDDLVVDGETGYRFKPNDLRSLISAMEARIKDEKEKVKIMSKNAHSIILGKSNVNNMVKIFSKAIDNLL